MRILVADDHRLVREAIVRTLRSNSAFSVCGEAVDGLDAVQQAAASKPDLVLIDISMPHLDGLAAAREIRRILPECHIVIVSQYDSPGVHEEAKRAGAIAFISKSDLSTQLHTSLTAIKQKVGNVDCVAPEPSSLLAPSSETAAPDQSQPSRPAVETSD